MTKFLQDRERDDASFFAFATYSDALAAAASDPSLETPFTFAVCGDWGSGKTSLLKTVARKVETKPKTKCMVVWFNAWKYEKTQQPLWSTFLNVVLTEMSDQAGVKTRERIKELTSKIGIMGSQILLSRIGGFALSDIEKIATSFQANLKGISNLRDELEKSIETILSHDGKKRERVVVFMTTWIDVYLIGSSKYSNRSSYFLIASIAFSSWDLTKIRSRKRSTRSFRRRSGWVHVMSKNSCS